MKEDKAEYRKLNYFSLVWNLSSNREVFTVALSRQPSPNQPHTVYQYTSHTKSDLLHHFPLSVYTCITYHLPIRLIKACEIQKQMTPGCVLRGVWIRPAVAWGWSSLWPGEQSTEILMNVLQTGIYEVSTNRMKLMERACQESHGFNALSPTITTTVSRTRAHTRVPYVCEHTRRHSPRCDSEV